MIAIAVDDEPIALDVVSAHAAKVPFVDLNAVFTNAFEVIFSGAKSGPFDRNRFIQ